MCSGIATLCLEVCARLRHEHMYLENHQIHSKESFGSSFSFLANMMKLCWFRQPLFQCSVIMRGGLVHVFFQPGLSGPELACMWASLPCHGLLHSCFFLHSAHHCSLCLCWPWRFAFILRFSLVFGAGFSLPLSWLLDVSLFILLIPDGTVVWPWFVFWVLYMYCVWSLIEVFGLPFEWFSVDMMELFCQ